MPSDLQEELLALLDNEQAALPGPGGQQPYRRVGSGSSSQPPRSDRSLPPSLKYWAHAPEAESRPDPPNEGPNEGSLARREHKGRGKPHCGRGTWRSIGRSFSRIALAVPAARLRSAALVALGCCALFVAKSHVPSAPLSSFLRRGGSGRWAGTRDQPAPRAQSSFLDGEWRGRAEVQYETPNPPSEIDFAIHRRLSVEKEDDCDDLLLYMPSRTSRERGEERDDPVADLHDYLLAALLATYTGKSMVVLEAPVERGGRFDCPVEESKRVPMDDGTGRADPPAGITRLIQHPPWLSRRCSVPCQASYEYSKWESVRKQRIREVTCQNDNDRQVKVFALGGDDAYLHFEHTWKERMLQRPSATAYDWALRLGARGHEAETFADLRKEEEIWDFVFALMARSGVVRFQPWVAKDVKALVEASTLPLDAPYAAVYVHEAKDAESTTASVSFHHYVKEFAGSNCDEDPRTIYVSTNDPNPLRAELGKNPISAGGEVVMRDCHKLKIVFNPSAEATHRADDLADCRERRRVDAAAMADLTILAKSDTFVGDVRSGMGRLVRIFRMALNNYPGTRKYGPVLVRNTLDTLGAIDWVLDG